MQPLLSARDIWTNGLPALAGRTTAPAAPTQDSAAARASPRPTTSWRVEWARSLEQVREAQRLRHRAFAVELGAHLAPPPGTPDDHDADDFDPHCEYLLVRASAAGRPSAAVGTYRVLTPEAARRAGGFYTDREFDLGPLGTQRRHLAEFGCACVHPAWRQGGVVLALWSALAEFLVRQGLPAVIGCASVGLGDGGHRAASLGRCLQRDHLATSNWRVEPHRPLPIDQLRQDLPAEPPALLKGYLRCGARVLGPPAWDPDFNVADFPLVLRLADLPPRYRRHLLGGA
jgi:putative hemolysin